MPIVLSLTGHLDLGGRRLSRSDARDWLARAAAWFEGVGDAVLDTRMMRDAEERPVLLVDLHPTSPPVEVRVYGSGKVRAVATTSPAGPGYHQHVLDLFLQLAREFAFKWVLDLSHDPTGFLLSRDRATLERAFLRWLAGACARTPRSVGVTLGASSAFPAEVLTPLGPRSREWAASVAEEPHRGGDFFPWWAPDLDAAFYRGRALCRLWSDFPWRAPLTEAEGEAADQIANDLATAFKLDPGAELPWSAWLELLAAIRDDARAERFCVTPTDPVLSVELWRRTGPVPEAESGPRVGYRRFPVRVPLDGGWSVEVPGAFATEWDTERNWTAWDATRTVWFRTVGFTKPGGAAPTTAEALEVGRRSLPEGEPVPGLATDDVRGEAVFGSIEEDGRPVWRLSGVAGSAGQLAVCNVYGESAADRDWAVQTWQSLRHAGGA